MPVCCGNHILRSDRAIYLISSNSLLHEFHVLSKTVFSQISQFQQYQQAREEILVTWNGIRNNPKSKFRKDFQPSSEGGNSLEFAHIQTHKNRLRQNLGRLHALGSFMAIIVLANEPRTLMMLSWVLDVTPRRLFSSSRNFKAILSASSASMRVLLIKRISRKPFLRAYSAIWKKSELEGLMTAKWVHRDPDLGHNYCSHKPISRDPLTWPQVFRTLLFFRCPCLFVPLFSLQLLFQNNWFLTFLEFSSTLHLARWNIDEDQHVAILRKSYPQTTDDILHSNRLLRSYLATKFTHFVILLYHTNFLFVKSISSKIVYGQLQVS